MRRIVLVLAVCVAVAGVSPAASAAAGYRPLRGKLTCSNPRPSAGETIAISGSGFAGGATVALAFDDAAAGTTTADASGAISTPFTIPTTATKGSHTISATGPTTDGATLRSTCTLRVQGSVAAALDGAEPVSTSRPVPSSPLAPMGVGIGIGAAVTVLFGWRRRIARR